MLERKVDPKKLQMEREGGREGERKRERKRETETEKHTETCFKCVTGQEEIVYSLHYPEYGLETWFGKPRSWRMETPTPTRCWQP